MKKKILIIDDERRFADMVKVNLELTERYEVFIEVKGTMGLTATRRYKPDLILLDVVMRDMIGLEVAQQIRSDTTLKGIPIVFLTAVGQDKIQCDAMQDEENIFIQKPVGTQDLVEFIDKRLGESS